MRWGVGVAGITPNPHIACTVTLRGVVQSDERRGRIELLSREVSHGLAIQNEITVCPPGAPAAPESLR